MRLTLGDACNPVISRIPASVGSNGGVTDLRLVAFINEAIQRLLPLGRWWGTYVPFNICATGGCITMPPQIATIESTAVCGRPIPIHDLWFEYCENGVGLRRFYQSTATSGAGSTCNQVGCALPEANYRGQFPVFSDIIPLGKKLLVVCDSVKDVDKPFLALGYDDNGNWIRTNQNGIIADGELIPLNQSAGTKSVNNFSAVTDVQIPSMFGQIWMYEYNISANTQRLIAHYQYWESRPSYARYFYPSVQQLINAGGCNNNTPPSIGVDCIGKLAFIPAVNATDYLILGCLPAIKEMVMALNRAENEADSVRANQIIAAGTTTAKMLLDQELEHYLGSGRRIGINLQGSGNPDGVPVENFV